MAANSSSIPPSGYLGQLAQIYREYKDKKSSSKEKTPLYINEVTREIKVFSGKVEEIGFQKLEKHHFQRIFVDVDGVDSKVLRQAVKALSFIPMGNDTDMDVTPLKGIHLLSLSEERIGEIDILLDQFMSFSRSEEGGNGVYFMSCEPLGGKHYPNGRLLIKLLDQDTTKAAALADRFLKEVGFTTPKSQHVSAKSPTGRKLIETINSNIEKSIQRRGLQEQTKDQCEQSDSIIVMNILEGETLSSLATQDVSELFFQEAFSVELGKMIFFDTLIHNPDRISAYRCALGNIMVEMDTQSIRLIDQEFRLNASNMGEVSERLRLLLNDDAELDRILDSINGAFAHRRLASASLPLSAEQTQVIRAGIRQGIVQAKKEFDELCADDSRFERLFPVHAFLEERECLLKVMERLNNHSPEGSKALVSEGGAEKNERKSKNEKCAIS